MSKAKRLQAIALIVFIICLFCTINLNQRSTFAAEDNIYFKNDIEFDIHPITKIENKDNTAPTITVLTAGLAAHAGNWSNSLNHPDESKRSYELSYTSDSIIEKLRRKAQNSIVLHGKYYTGDKITIEKLSQQTVEFADYGRSVLTELSAEDIADNVHIILIADLTYEGALASHEEAYREFHTIVDKVVYNVFELTNQIPRVNLIGHSRGGILNLKYAIDHPFNVAQMFSIGTPYLGTNLGKIGVEMSKEYPSLFEEGSFLNSAVFLINSKGGEDCANTDIANQLREQWRISVENSGADIPVHAVGGVTDFNYLASGIDKDSMLYPIVWILTELINSPLIFSQVTSNLFLVDFILAGF